MTGMLTCAFVAILLGWVVWALGGLVLGTPLALAAGGIVAMATLFFLRDTLLVRGLVAVLGPLGVILPALALRQMAAGAGAPVTPFGTAELLIFAAGYAVFLASAMGVVPVDLYRLGYAPLPVGVMVLALCAYGILAGNLFVPLVAVLGQALWVMGWGSSNWFDHVLHAFLMPVVIVLLLARLV